MFNHGNYLRFFFIILQGLFDQKLNTYTENRNVVKINLNTYIPNNYKLNLKIIFSSTK